MGANDPTTHTYNYENLLASITLPDDSVTSYVYCALGKRVMKTDSSGTLLYRPDGDNILLEQDGSGNTIVAYTYNPFGLVGNVISNRKSGTDSYYHYDATGNVMDLTNSGETVVTTYNYDAFGNILAGASANNKVGFQTKPWEGTDIGLYYSRARYYDPAVGRFTSRDPIPSTNLYVYCWDNPVNWLDPLGLKDYKWWETQQLLAEAYASATAGRFRGLLNIYKNSKGYGPYDFGNTQKNRHVLRKRGANGSRQIWQLYCGFSGWSL